MMRQRHDSEAGSLERDQRMQALISPEFPMCILSSVSLEHRMIHNLHPSENLLCFSHAFVIRISNTRKLGISKWNFLTDLIVGSMAKNSVFQLASISMVE
jgi:hypothetical protein